MSELEVSEAASPHRMHHSLRYSFPVEFSDFVDQVNVAEEDGSSWAGGERVLVVVHWHARAGRQCLLLERR